MTKIKLHSLVIYGVIPLLLLPVSCRIKNPINKEPTIELSQKQLMVIYKNGYLNGKLNELLHSHDGMSQKIWEIDSTSISNMFFK